MFSDRHAFTSKCQELKLDGSKPNTPRGQSMRLDPPGNRMKDVPRPPAMSSTRNGRLAWLKIISDSSAYVHVSSQHDDFSDRNAAPGKYQMAKQKKPKPSASRVHRMRTAPPGALNDILNDTTKLRKFQGCSTLKPKPILRIGVA
jgi:hypothetical protein